MYKDSVITAISDLSFYGKVLIKYLDKNDEEVVTKFELNKDKAVTGIVIVSNDTDIENLNFNTIEDFKEYLEKIKNRIFLIEVA